MEPLLDIASAAVAAAIVVWIVWGGPPLPPPPRGGGAATRVPFWHARRGSCASTASSRKLVCAAWLNSATRPGKPSHSRCPRRFLTPFRWARRRTLSQSAVCFSASAACWPVSRARQRSNVRPCCHTTRRIPGPAPAAPAFPEASARPARCPRRRKGMGRNAGRGA